MTLDTAGQVAQSRYKLPKLQTFFADRRNRNPPRCPTSAQVLADEDRRSERCVMALGRRGFRNRVEPASLVVLALIMACAGEQAGPVVNGGGVMTTAGGDTEGTDGDDSSETTDDKFDLPAGTATDGDPETGAEEECASFTEAAQSEKLPADIIFVVDNSGSMGDEAAAVQANLNSFSQQIIDSGVDAHVVLLSSYPNDGNGICVDPPLGAGGCNDVDTNLPQFLHIDERIGSTDALLRLLQRAPEWMPSVRPESGLHVVVVTDDESNLDALTFDSQFKALNPDFADYKLHGIVSMQDCSDAADIGNVYISLGQMTGGLVADLCLQNFQPVFDLLATEVISGSSLSCEWAIPEPPPGEDLDIEKVNVEYDDGAGMPELIGKVETSAECGNVADGWFYDNPANPTMIVACPQTCDRMQDALMATINIQLGCETVPAG